MSCGFYDLELRRMKRKINDLKNHRWGLVKRGCKTDNIDVKIKVLEVEFLELIKKKKFKRCLKKAISF